MSLLTECNRWSERAILALTMTLARAARKCTCRPRWDCRRCSPRGMSEAARVALNRGLAIAEERDDSVNQLQLLGPLHMFHFRIGDFKAALNYAKRSSAVAATVGIPAAIALARSLLGISLTSPYRRPWQRPRGARGSAAARAGRPARPARSCTASIITTSPVVTWRGRCGCKAIRLSPRDARAHC